MRGSGAIHGNPNSSRGRATASQLLAGLLKVQPVGAAQPPANRARHVPDVPTHQWPCGFEVPVFTRTAEYSQVGGSVVYCTHLWWLGR